MSGKITRYSFGEAKKDHTDWERLDRLTDAEIEADAAADPDVAPIVDQAWFESAELILPEPKQAVSLRIDSDVLRWFRDSGPGYQSRMNAILREYAAAHGASVAGRSARTRRKAG